MEGEQEKSKSWSACAHKAYRKYKQHTYKHTHRWTVLQGDIKKKDTREWWNILSVISLSKIILHLHRTSFSRARSSPLLSKVRGCRCCFSLATLGGAIPLCRWLTDGGCGCVYCYKVVAPPLKENTRGQSHPPNTDLRSPVLSADWSLCFLEALIGRSVLEGNLPPGKLAQVRM